jgi:hypothetical protein
VRITQLPKVFGMLPPAAASVKHYPTASRQD